MMMRLLTPSPRRFRRARRSGLALGHDPFAGLRLLSLFLLGLFAAAPAARGEADYELPPINYRAAESHDPVAELQRRIACGKARLDYEPGHGYLVSLLKQLGVPVSSQMLVFSKTSFQRQLISPTNPRALYFADNVYVGYVNGGEVIELSAMDPQLGPVYYTLDQRGPDPGGPSDPTPGHFTRQTDECLQCHESALTHNYPGHVVRSLYVDGGGMPILSAGTFRTSHQSPLKERWGGWYVTGTSGSQHHLGNQIADKDHPESLDPSAGSNLTSLRGKLDASAYLADTSDLVALMVMEHQTYVQNLLTAANYKTRLALRDEGELAKALGERFDPDGPEHSASTRSRIKSACEPLVKALVFADEASLTDAVRGVSPFAREFASAGPRDRRGRSLRDLDLDRRLFRYPCSYLIDSDAFEGLPPAAKAYVYRRLWDVLNGSATDNETAGEFAHFGERFSAADREAARDILRETKRGLPAYWGAAR